VGEGDVRDDTAGQGDVIEKEGIMMRAGAEIKVRSDTMRTNDKGFIAESMLVAGRCVRIKVKVGVTINHKTEWATVGTRR
jgi:hypothetical protein